MDGCKVSENRHNIVFLDVCGESGEWRNSDRLTSEVVISYRRI